MRLLNLLPAFFLFTFGNGYAQDAAPVPAKETVKFDGQTLVLASQNKDEKTKESIKEYIPAGEKFESYTKLASIHIFPQLDDPLTAVAGLQEALKKNYPGAPSRVLKNSKSGEALIDFIIIFPDNAFAEFNVMKYAKNPGGGLVMYQYSLREYGDNIERFLKGIPPVRERLVNQMATTGFQISK